MTGSFHVDFVDEDAECGHETQGHTNARMLFLTGCPTVCNWTGHAFGMLPDSATPKKISGPQYCIALLSHGVTF